MPPPGDALTPGEGLTPPPIPHNAGGTENGSRAPTMSGGGGVWRGVWAGVADGTVVGPIGGPVAAG